MTTKDADTLVREGLAADQLLASDAFKAAVEGVRTGAIAEWIAATTVEAREAAWHRARAVEAIENELRVVRDRGKAAARGR